MAEVSIVGLDLAKSVFQVHGARADGSVVFKRKLPRSKVLPFFAARPGCVVAMEACASARHWAREIGALGHEVSKRPVSTAGSGGLSGLWQGLVEAGDQVVVDAGENVGEVGLGVGPTPCSPRFYGQLGREQDAARAAARLLELYPDFEERTLIESARQHVEPAVLERFVTGLRKAGLEIPVPTAKADQFG